MDADRGRADRDRTAGILAGLPGGPELLAWFGGVPNFGDGEVIGLALDRAGPSTLRVLAINSSGGADARGFFPRAIVTFTFAEAALGHIVDVSLRAFSEQNVIDSLVLHRTGERPVHPTEVGVGLGPGEHEIELEPIYGAHGTIRATIARVAFDPVEPG